MTAPVHRTALVWLRRDLRLADNPALAHACEQAQRVIPVYIHEPDKELGRWPDGAAARWWLHHSLTALQTEIKKRGGRLIIKSGRAAEVLQVLARETKATLVTWNRLYEPAAIERDKVVKATLRATGLAAESFNAALLFEPWTVRTSTETPYKVFTPFYRACTPALLSCPQALPAPLKLSSPPRGCTSETLDSLELKPDIPWDGGMRKAWRPGEAAALEALEDFADQTVDEYPKERNRPDHPGTSRLSPYLHFGELSARQIVNRLSSQLRAGIARQTGAEAYVRQLVWREFAHHLLFHFPHTPEKPLDERFSHYAWRKDAAALRAWQRGRTGYPMVDAGMRELWTTGWMHNRVRMCVASFLTKNLRIHWLEGARWFWDTLVDADLANNTLGWQWTAGCGADAAPYYRVFNPVLQAEKFDPERAYLRRWIPELAKLPDRWIHRPWEAPADVLAQAGVKLGRTYPAPIVELKASRDAALAGYQKMRDEKP